MNINFNELSSEELLELKKKVSTELKTRGKVTKESLNIYDQLHCLFHDELSNEIDEAFPYSGGFDSECYIKHKILSPMESSIFKLADITFKNYKWTLRKRTRRLGGGNIISLQVNPLLVYSNCKKYKDMCDDIISIIEKYKEETNEQSS